MNNFVKFVPAERKDLPVIAQLAPEIWQYACGDILSARVIARMLKSMYAPEKLQADFDNGVKFRLIDSDSGHIGFFAVFECNDDRLTLTLDKLCLKPDFHGRGIGRKVLQYLAECASNAGYKAIRLNVCQSNAAAIRIFLKNGFKKKASVKTDIGNGFFTDDFIMEKKIM